MTLPEGEALFRAVFEQSAVGVALIDSRTGRYLRVNQSHCNLLGYSREELEELGFPAVTHPDDLAADLANMQRLMAGEIRSFTMEKRYFRKDGGVVWASLTVSPLWAAGETPAFHVAVVQDITERKRAEASLRDTEELFSQLLERSPIHVFFKDDAVRSLRLSRNYEQMLGRPLAEVLGKTMEEVFPSPLAAGMVADDRRILREGKVVEVDEELHGRRYHTIKFPIHREGRSSYLGGFTMDITDRYLAEMALRESEEKYRTLYNEAPVMLHSIDASGRLVSVSNRWLEVLGYERHEVLGRKSTDFLTAASRRYAEEVVLPGFFRTGTLADVHLQFMKRNGEVLDILLSAVTERNTAGEFVCSRAALTDITERNRMEEALRQSQKMESVGRLAGGLAHDFNNLLVAIQGNTEFALMELAPHDPIRTDLVQVQKAAARAAKLTSQLLAFSRKQVLQPRTFNLNRIVVEVDTMLRRLIGEDIERIHVLAPDLALTRADPGQIEQVLVNLVINARDAMPRGGRITIETANVSLEGAGAWVQLSVIDSGAGMDAAVLEHVFEPFFTTKEKGKGTGLGLATAYGIIKQSGGDIAVHSTAGVGTRFDVRLPVHDGEETHYPVTPTLETHARGKETILLVEDEEVARDLSRRVLERAGYTVLEASQGAEGLQRCVAHPGTVDLVLTDVVMPLMGGQAMVARLLELRPRIKVLYMSGYSEDAILHHGVLQPGTAFIPKPFTLDELARRVRQTLDT